MSLKRGGKKVSIEQPGQGSKFSSYIKSSLDISEEREHESSSYSLGLEGPDLQRTERAKSTKEVRRIEHKHSRLKKRELAQKIL